MSMERMVRIATLIAFSSSCVMCVWNEYDAAQAARDDYESCRREHAAAAEKECQAAWERYEAEYRHYEDEAQKAWESDCERGKIECPAE